MADRPEEGQDPLAFYREKCESNHHVAKFKQLLDECNERVTSRSNTEETCQQEMVDYVHHLDHCAMPKAFKELK
ncbi:Protein T27E9.2 [Aphelenchoides avenae]|nr:Protein T27E9.2 [Aphelenchus avenae]